VASVAVAAVSVNDWLDNPSAGGAERGCCLVGLITATRYKLAHFGEANSSQSHG